MTNEEQAAEAAQKKKAEAEAAEKARREAKVKNSVVLLTWKPARPWVIHLPQSGGVLSVIMQRSADPNAVVTPEEVQEALSAAKPLTIIPGTNEYPAGMWELVKDHPDVKSQMADGQLVLQTNDALGLKPNAADKLEGVAQSLPANLGKLAVDKARELADNCDDMDILKTWLKNEQAGQKRQSVLDTLQNKIAMVKDVNKRFEGDGGAQD